MSDLYELKLRPGFPAPRRVRAGVEVPAGTGIEVELDSDQVKAIKADDQIVMRKVRVEHDDSDEEAAKRSEAAKKAAATRKANQEQKAREEAAEEERQRQLIDEQNSKNA